MSEPVPITRTVFSFTYSWENGNQFFACPMPVVTNEEALALAEHIQETLTARPTVMVQKVTTTILEENLVIPPPPES